MSAVSLSMGQNITEGDLIEVFEVKEIERQID